MQPQGRRAPSGATRMDWLAGLGVLLVSLGVYVRTLAPGVIPILDTPGFQFVGRVLGTLHNSGYPTYVLITHAWSYLPIGSLAYRINLFSAVCGSMAIAGVFVLLRLLDVRWWIAAPVALGMAFGSIYWSQAIIAEVYTLNAATTIWMLAALVRWAHARRDSLLFVAAGLFALGLGNHTTIVLFAPGMVVYALLVDHGRVLRLRTLLALFLIALAGVAQYLFILIRTRMQAVYLESRASDLGELVDVIRGAQFEHALFTFTPAQILSERLPLIAGRFVVAELTMPVLLVAVLGIGLLVVRRPREAVLLIAGLLLQLAFVLNYDAGDIHVFTIPSILLLWCCAGYGLEALVRRLLRAQRAERLVTIAAAIALTVLPLWQLARNFNERDLSGDTQAVRQLDALFTALPDDSFLVRENFVLDRMLMYKLLGEAAGAAREVQAHHSTADGAAAMVESGRHVFVFSETAHRFRYEGVDVRFSPFTAYEWTLDQFVRALPEGSVVALGVPAVHAPAFHARAGEALRSMGLVARSAGRERAAVAAVARIGSSIGNQIQLDARSAASVTLGDVMVRADALMASIEVAGRERITSEDGAVLTVVSPQGDVQSIRSLSAEAGFRIRSAPGSFIPSPVIGRMPSQVVGPAWTRLSDSTGFWLFTVPAGGSVEILVPVRAGCDLRAVEKSAEALQVSRPRDVPDPPTDLPGEGGYVLLRLTASEPAGAFVTAGCRTSPFVRATGNGARVHDVRLDGLLDLPDRTTATVLMARTNQSWLLGSGWSPVDVSRAGPFRWISEPIASVVLPVEGAEAQRLRVQALAGGDDTDLALSLEVNGRTLPAQRLTPGWARYEWNLEERLVQGLHEVRIMARHASGRPAEKQQVAISEIEVLGRRTW